MDRIEIYKVELADGEEMQGLIKKVVDAITRSKGKTKKSLGLAGIYKDHIITRDFESGRFFKMAMQRDDSGNIKLGDEVEVKQVFIPVKQKTEKDDATNEILVAIDEGETATVRTVKADAEAVAEVLDAVETEAPEYIQPKEKDLWQGVL